MSVYFEATRRNDAQLLAARAFRFSHRRRMANVALDVQEGDMR
jgi:hypothetical protein